MSIFLDRTPFSDKPEEVVVRGERIRIRDHQIILWMSLTLSRVAEPNPSAVPFPVILDTGHTHSFSIRQQHLIEWAGLQPDVMRVIDSRHDRERGIRLNLREANLWLHCNEQGQRDRLADRPARRIRAKKGIAIYPEGNFPRLPILGLRAIAENGLLLKINGGTKQATLRTPLKWWPFA